MSSAFSAFGQEINSLDLTYFAKDSLIETKERIKYIQDVQTGDLVKSFDEEKQEFVNGKVSKTFKKQTLSHLQITLCNGELIEVTEEHPFYTSTGWVSAKELKPDSKIKTINGFINISSIKRLEGEIEVFNFEVEKFHTYLVGTTGLVVHNKCSENNPYLVNWRKHKASGGTALDFGFEGEVSDQEFLDFISSPEGNAYITELGRTNQDINKFIAIWVAGRVVNGVGFFKWLGESLQSKVENNIIQQSFKDLSNLENKGVLYADKQLRSKGFEFVGRTTGGYYKYYNSNGAKVQIRPNGQIYRYSGKGKNIIRYDSSGKVTLTHGQEFLF